MEMERQRQTHSKEIESKDEEVEEIRRSCSKKVGVAHFTLSALIFLIHILSSLNYQLARAIQSSTEKQTLLFTNESQCILFNTAYSLK